MSMLLLLTSLASAESPLPVTITVAQKTLKGDFWDAAGDPPDLRICVRPILDDYPELYKCDSSKHGIGGKSIPTQDNTYSGEFQILAPEGAFDITVVDVDSMYNDDIGTIHCTEKKDRKCYVLGTEPGNDGDFSDGVEGVSIPEVTPFTICIDASKTADEGVMCAGKETDRQNGLLREVLAKKASMYNDAGKDVLESEQREWVKSLTSLCPEPGTYDGANGRLLQLVCLADATDTRVKALSK